MYEIKSDSPFYYTLKILNLMGYFPSRNDKEYMRKFYSICCLRTTLQLFVITGTSWHFFHYYKGNDNIDVTEDISITFGITFALSGLLLFSTNAPQWSYFFINVNDFTVFGKPTNFDSTTKKMNTFSVLYFSFVILGTIIYGLVSVYETWGCSNLNTTITIREVCGTYVPIYFPADIEVGFAFKWSIFMFQYTVLLTVNSPAAITCYLVLESTEILISHIYSLKQKLMNIAPDDIRSNLDDIKHCVCYHIHIIRMFEDVKINTKTTVGHIPVVAAVILGSISNQILSTKPLGALIFLSGYVIALFMICHAAQRISNEMASIGEAAYFTEWHNFHPICVKMLIIIMKRSQKSFCYVIQPDGEINYELFLKIMKASYSYMTLLAQQT